MTNLTDFQRAVKISTDRQALVSVSPTMVDNTQLSTSLIGWRSCLEARDEVEADLNLNQEEFGFSHENCLLSQVERIVQDTLGCSFVLINSTQGSRCSPGNATTFLSSHKSESDDGECPQDCVQTRYSLSVTQTDLADSLKIRLQDKISSGEVSVTKLVMAGTDFMRITTRPQPVIQFLAEVGGLLAFFLGMSAISLCECCCFGAARAKAKYEESVQMRKVSNDNTRANSNPIKNSKNEVVAPVETGQGSNPSKKQGNKAGGQKGRVQLPGIKKSERNK